MMADQSTADRAVVEARTDALEDALA